MAIWGNRGDWYSIDYTIGDDINVKRELLFLRDKDKISIEASLMTMLARQHGVNNSAIRPIHIIRTEV